MLVNLLNLFTNPMNLDCLDKNEIYLLIGKDFESFLNSKLYKTNFLNVEFYFVDDNKIINSPIGYKCTCNNFICWHILKVITDKDNCDIKKFNIEMFN